MASDLLYSKLADALSRPSNAYLAAQEGLAIPGKVFEGYQQGANFADEIRKRKLAQQTLSEALGGRTVPGLESFGNTTVQGLTTLVPAITAGAALDKANRPDKSNVPNSLEEILAQNVREGKMTMEDAMKAKASMTPSLFPKPEPGFRFDKNGNLIPIPGGTPARKIAEEDIKKKMAVDAQKAEADLVIKKINDTLGQVNSFSAGGMAGTKDIPLLGQATGASDLASNLDTITSSLGLNKLMEMKSNSKAGASGMGQLSDREMNLLTSALTSVKQSQSPEQLKKHLGDVKTHYQNILKMNQGINPFSQKVRVSNGQETLEIDPTDIPNAMQDGYKPVQ